MIGSYRVPAAAITRAESLMSDTVRWTRHASATGPVVIDPVTGSATAAAASTVFTGPCRLFTRIRPRSFQGQSSAGDTVVLETTFAAIPLSAPTLQMNDVGTLVASAEHPGDVGMVVRVSALLRGSQSTRQLVQVQSVND